MKAKQPYECPRCGYVSARKSNMCQHFFAKKNPCPCVKADVELTQEVTDYVLTNRIYRTRKHCLKMNPNKRIQELETALLFYKQNKREQFYQGVVECFLNASHKTLACGITDVTTDTIHAEIKKWDDWKAAVGQLISYNIEDPKEDLHAYMFGSFGKKSKKSALDIMAKAGLKVFEFNIGDKSCSIVDANSGLTVYEMHFD
jgi:hypothetical protein